MSIFHCRIINPQEYKKVDAISLVHYVVLHQLADSYTNMYIKNVDRETKGKRESKGNEECTFFERAHSFSSSSSLSTYMIYCSIGTEHASHSHCHFYGNPFNLYHIQFMWKIFPPTLMLLFAPTAAHFLSLVCT